MIFRLITLVAALTAVALLVLAIRQQRLATARVVAESHATVDRLRLETRTLMTPISAKTTPEEIKAGCKRANIKLEPVDAPGQAPVDPAAGKKPGAERGTR